MSRWWWDLLDETRGWLIALVIALIVLGTVAACGDAANRPPEREPEPFTEVAYGRAQVYDVTSPGGVRCVVVRDGGNGISVSCDWGER